MSTEVSNQNRQLSRIQEKVLFSLIDSFKKYLQALSNESRVDSANKRTSKLITK